jgi:sensor histidine kinase YesM
MNKALFLTFFITFSHFTVSAQNIDSLEAIVNSNAIMDSSQLENLYTLGDYYLNRDPKKATKFFLKGYQFSREKNYRYAEARFGRFLGISERRLNEYDSAKYFLNRSLVISKELGESENLGLTYSSLGNLYKGLSMYDSAVHYYLEGVKVFEQIDNPKGLGTTYNGLGTIYLLMKDYDKATYYLKLAANQLEKVSEYGVAVVTNNIGSIFFKLDQFDSALVYFLRSKDIKERLNLKNGLDAAYLNIGIVYTNTQKYELANEYLQKSLVLRKSLKNKEKLIQCYNNLAELNIIIGKYEKAQQYLDESKLLTDEIGSLEELQYILKYQLRLDSLEGNYKHALHTALSLSKVQDSLTGFEKTKQIAELETKYETEKKDSEIALLSQQAQIQELLISQRNIQLIGAGIILILLISGGLIYYQQRKIRHQQSVSDLEQRMLRLQMNPHFIFNALSSIQNYILKSDTKESVQYLAKFARLMRQILEHSRQDFISIDEEADMLKNYLTIQQLRFSQLKEFSVTVDPAIDTENTEIPPLFAQPFVENALEHGLIDPENDGKIDIRFSLSNDNIILEISDNGKGLESTEVKVKEHQSLATRITRERLELLSKRYKRQFNLELFSNELKGTTARLLIPSKNII